MLFRTTKYLMSIFPTGNQFRHYLFRELFSMSSKTLWYFMEAMVVEIILTAAAVAFLGMKSAPIVHLVVLSELPKECTSKIFSIKA